MQNLKCFCRLSRPSPCCSLLFVSRRPWFQRGVFSNVTIDTVDIAFALDTLDVMSERHERQLSAEQKRATKAQNAKKAKNGKKAQNGKTAKNGKKAKAAGWVKPAMHNKNEKA